jgi:hypothetical protein
LGLKEIREKQLRQGRLSFVSGAANMFLAIMWCVREMIRFLQGKTAECISVVREKYALTVRAAL